MNDCKFLGKFVADPELKKLEDNRRVTNFKLAVSESYKKSGGDLNREVSFPECEAWDTGADTICKNFKKGDYIIVNARLRTERWEDKETGKPRSKSKFRVTSFEFLPAE
jgi:single-strand DNA-binding protein